MLKNMLLYIQWNPSIDAFHIGPLSFRWYSLCWLLGLVLAFLAVRKLYKDLKIPMEKFDPLFLYCFVGILVGARLGHCIFYQPEYYLTSGKGFIEMLLPIHFLPDGGWKLTGYEGLASHGGTLGLILALLVYVRRMKMPVWQVLDIIGVATGITACFIRLGNLMNSEIIGKPTDVPWAFIFQRVDNVPRHPGQLYEAIAYACFFFILWAIYRKTSRPTGKDGKLNNNPLMGTGFYFGLDILLIFLFRFFIEYTKEVQEAFEADMLFDMGQLLSIPFILIGAYFTWRGLQKAKQNNPKL